MFHSEDVYPTTRQETYLSKRVCELAELAERRGEQLRQSDVQIARLRAALEEISLGGNGRAGLLADRVLHEQWGD